MRFIVAMTGASGQIFGVRLLEILRDHAEIHLVISSAARITAEHELDVPLSQVEKLADFVYSEDDIAARIASGSFRHDGMAIVPCSIKTLSSIAYGMADNLITRAADVTLKERRKLVLAVRETPLHINHLRAMVRVTEAGGVVMPPVPAFYIRPEKIEDIVDHFASRVAEVLGVQVDYRRWE
ncbi:UbiX family flavin prenyltransferase [Geoglobus acetivorans]